MEIIQYKKSKKNGLKKCKKKMCKKLDLNQKKSMVEFLQFRIDFHYHFLNDEVKKHFFKIRPNFGRKK